MIGLSRKEKKANTKVKLLDALNRLLENKPQSPKLIKRSVQGNLKINAHAVEIEAGLSIGSLRHHPDVISKIRSEKLKYNENTDHSSEHNELILKEQEIKELKKKVKNANNIKAQYHKEIINLNNSMAEQLSKHHCIVVALSKKIPTDNLVDLFHKHK